jgi:endonuclease/exonuclease/phosphatase (EEP) superfamily protein YafD
VTEVLDRISRRMPFSLTLYRLFNPHAPLWPWLVTGLRIALGLLAAGGLLCALGGKFAALDLLNHATPLFFLAAQLLVLLSVFVRPIRPALAVLGAVAALLTGLILAHDPPSRSPAGPDDGPRLTVLEHNVWARNERPLLTADSIVAQHADVVALVEVEEVGRVIAEKVREHYPYSTHCLDDRWCKMEIFSRYPIVGSQQHIGAWRLPEGDYLSWVSADIDGGELGRFTVYATKLVHPNGDDAGVQARQIAQLESTLAKADPQATIVTGDLNLTPWSFRLRRLDAALGLRRVTQALPTWPARIPHRHGLRFPFPLIGIDHLYAGSDWSRVAASRAPATGSDHYPVIATLARTAGGDPADPTRLRPSLQPRPPRPEARRPMFSKASR